MPNYRYEIKQSTGQMQAGVVTAATATAAATMLKGQGGYVISLTEDGQAKQSTLQSILNFKVERGPRDKDILNFTNQLAVMIKAGISIRAALEGIAEQTENEKFREILHTIRRDIEGGKSFSESLSKYPKVFNPLYINMVRASELSGSFGSMLDRIAGYMSQQIETRSQVKGAMIYPMIIAFMAVSSTIFLLTFVLPKFVGIFEGKEDMLPAPTKFILFLSETIRTYWYILILGNGGAIWGFLYFTNTENGRQWWDALKLKIPVIKKLCRCLYISRSLHTMGELVNAGVPMLDTISITGKISGNTVYKKMWKRVFLAVKEGKKISFTLTNSKELPSSVVQMISSGEESGKLADVLQDVSGYYQKELKAVIRAVTAMIEPIMIVLMGFVVGFIAMAIMLPVFKLSTLAKGG
ncbi:MAG: type II secretion system F family protein [Phycisphaerae bacterium]|nr:type II secretion system F family protein [Phycisphaerae bacterium]